MNAYRFSGFRQILELEDLPRLTDAFYREPISGAKLLEMRDHPDTKRLRRWLADSDGEDGKAISAAYLKAIRKNVHDDSVTKSGFRAFGTIAAGFVGAVVGPIATVADWAFSRFYYRRAWNPRVFIDRVLPEALARAHRDLVVPPDTSRLVREGWRVVEFEHSVAAGARLKFARDVGETFNIKYGTSVDDYRLLNTIVDQLLAAAGCSSVMIQCFGCKQTNRFPADRAVGIKPSCGACKVKLLPFIP